MFAAALFGECCAAPRLNSTEGDMLSADAFLPTPAPEVAAPPAVREPVQRSLVTQRAPDFTAQAAMPDGSFKEVRLSDFSRAGKYVLLLFYPLDFAFVCPSELVALEKVNTQLADKGVQVLGVSIDSKFTHRAWRGREPRQGGVGRLSYPLVSDVRKRIAKEYGVLAKGGDVALRGTFLIDRQGTVRHASVNDLPLGRSMEEAERLVDALQYHEKHGEVCPANWRKGADAMQPNAQGVASYLAKHG